MKLPLDQRTAFADQVLTKLWPMDYWSRDEQLFACAEGWCITTPFDYVGADCIVVWRADLNVHDFETDDEAVAYVLKRAQEGSPLHCRALTLHAAYVLKHGKPS